MIGIDVQISKQQRLVAGLVTAAVGLDGDKYGINLRQGLSIVEP